MTSCCASSPIGCGRARDRATCSAGSVVTSSPCCCPTPRCTAALDRAEEIRRELLEAVTIAGIRLHVGVSIGVGSCPVPASTTTELLRCADVAMYAAKRTRTGVRAYLQEPASSSAAALRAMDELHTALATGAVDVHLQPQVALDDGRVVGVEALVRWMHPERGIVPPAELLPVAARAGLLSQVAEHVLDRSLAAAARWWPQHEVAVSVNLDAVDVVDLDLPARVTAALARHGLPAAALTLEVVEDTLVVDPDRARAVLGELRGLGVRVSIDDYGTGYSSLAYLDRLPADELKLDRSLVLGTTTGPTGVAIVRHTTALAHELGLTLVAEGVEDDATAELLRALGCDRAQGYGIARPMPVEAFLGWLATRTAESAISH